MFDIYRKDPNGKEIFVVTKPKKENEKIYVENSIIKNKTVSKLVIMNLELYDSGRYELFADNGVLKQNINVSLFVKGN